MSDRANRKSPDLLLKAYFEILRDMGPDAVLERRIEEQETHLHEEAAAPAKAS